jgi:hypothetical protein
MPADLALFHAVLIVLLILSLGAEEVLPYHGR